MRCVLGAVMGACLAVMVHADTPLGTGFTYQGQLKQSGMPLTGNGDFRFTLWDAASEGAQVGSGRTISNVPVSSGLFTVALDFGPTAFNGNARWLEIAVAWPTRSGNYTTLSPRQPLTAAPYAIFASTAQTANGPWTISGSGLGYTGGSVGIGTLSPPYLLSVLGPQAVAYLESASAGNGSVLELRNTTASPSTLGAINFNNAANSYPGQLAYLASNAMTFRTNGGEQMRVDSAGKVGIGITSPSEKLDVAGVIRSATGGFKFPDGSVQTTAARSPWYWAPNRSGIYYNGGNVGVGTLKPTQMLHLTRPQSAIVQRFQSTRYQTDPGPGLEMLAQPTAAANLGGGPPWSNTAGSIYSEDNRASAYLSKPSADNGVSGVLQWSGFSFTIPQDATITGIQVELEGYGVGSCADCDACLPECQSPLCGYTCFDPYSIQAAVKLATGGASSAEEIFELQSQETVSTLGSAVENWGANWTPAQINSPSFSVQLTAQLALRTVIHTGWFHNIPAIVDCDSCSGDGTAYIDSIYVTVYYRPAGTTQVVPLEWTLGVAQTGTSFQLAPTADLSSPVVSVLQNGTVGIGTTDPGGFLLAVNGNAGKPGGGAWSVLSDSRLKHDVEPMDGTLDRLLKLHGYTFEYAAEAVRDRLALPGRQMGLLAEEVEQVFPDWVEKDAGGYRYLTERSTTALMVEALRDLRAEKDCAMAELQARNDALVAENKKLEARLAAVEAAVARLTALKEGGRP